jgi:hypothetical protein
MYAVGELAQLLDAISTSDAAASKSAAARS